MPFGASPPLRRRRWEGRKFLLSFSHSNDARALNSLPLWFGLTPHPTDLGTKGAQHIRSFREKADASWNSLRIYVHGSGFPFFLAPGQEGISIRQRETLLGKDDWPDRSRSSTFFVSICKLRENRVRTMEVRNPATRRSFSYFLSHRCRKTHFWSP